MTYNGLYLYDIQRAKNAELLALVVLYFKRDKFTSQHAIHLL